MIAIVALYLIPATGALALTWDEGARSGRSIDRWRIIGYLLCIAWPLILLWVIVHGLSMILLAERERRRASRFIRSPGNSAAYLAANSDDIVTVRSQRLPK